MTIRELIQRLLLDTKLDDQIVFFDMDDNVFKEVAIERLGTTVYCYIKDVKKSDMQIREDFFKNA